MTPTPPVTKIRFYPRADFSAASRMTGGKFQGSNDKEGWTDLATIKDKPAEASWTEISVSGAASYRYLRYLAPPNSFGNVAEIEFYAGAKKLTGVPFGPRGSFLGGGSGFKSAFDDNIATSFNAPTQDNAFAGIDTQGSASVPPTVPLGLVAMPGNGQVWLVWNYSSGGTSYTVKRSRSAGGPYKTLATIQTADSTPGYRDVGLTNGSSYTYVISCGNKFGESAASASATVMPAVPAFDGLTRIMPLGDSITGGNGGERNYRLPLYNKLIAAGYKFHFVGSLSTPPPPESANEGHGGWEAADLSGAQQPPYWEPQDKPNGVGVWLPLAQPDIILLQAGTNDLLRGKPDPAKRLSNLIDKIHAVWPSCHIIVAQIVANGLTNDVTTLNTAIPIMVKARAAKGWKIQTVDMWHALNYPADFADGVHPTVSGYGKMADVWYTALTPYLKK